MHPKPSRGNGSVTYDDVACVEAGDLPWGGALGRLVELDRQMLVCTGGQPSGHAAGKTSPVGAHAHPVDAAAVAVQRRLAHRHLAREQRLRKPLVGARVPPLDRHQRLDERRPLYVQAATDTVATDHLDIDAVADRVEALL